MSERGRLSLSLSLSLSLCVCVCVCERVSVYVCVRTCVRLRVSVRVRVCPSVCRDANECVTVTVTVSAYLHSGRIHFANASSSEEGARVIAACARQSLRT